MNQRYALRTDDPALYLVHILFAIVLHTKVPPTPPCAAYSMSTDPYHSSTTLAPFYFTNLALKLVWDLWRFQVILWAWAARFLYLARLACWATAQKMHLCTFRSGCVKVHFVKDLRSTSLERVVQWWGDLLIVSGINITAKKHIPAFWAYLSIRVTLGVTRHAKTGFPSPWLQVGTLDFPGRAMRAEETVFDMTKRLVWMDDWCRSDRLILLALWAVRSYQAYHDLLLNVLAIIALPIIEEQAALLIHHLLLHRLAQPLFLLVHLRLDRINPNL